MTERPIYVPTRPRLYLVTAPPVEPVTLEEVKAWLRVDHADDNTVLEGLIRAARRRLDGRDGYLGRALVLQTWDWKLSGLPTYDAAIALPLPPLREVVHVKYRDGENVEQAWASSSYVVTGADRWTPGDIALAAGGSWPSLYGYGGEDVTIRITAGYAPDNMLAPTDYRLNIPEDIKLAIKMMVAAWYDNRASMGTMPDGVRDLLASYRVEWL